MKGVPDFMAQFSRVLALQARTAVIYHYKAVVRARSLGVGSAGLACDYNASFVCTDSVLVEG